jgi:hypothetical protein
VNLQKLLAFVLKTLALTVLLTIVMITVSSAVVPMESFTAEQESTSLLPLLIVCLTYALIFNLVVSQTRWSGTPLVLGLMVGFYGVHTLLGQIEALVFLTPLGERWGAGSVPALTMPLDFILSQFAVGAALSVAGAPAAAALFGKLKRSESQEQFRLFPDFRFGQWMWKLGAVILLYEVLYFGFGYYVAWKNPAVAAFYQGTDPGSFLVQMQHVITETPTLIPFQALRALLWAAFTLPAIAMLRRKGLLGAVLAGLFISLPMNIPHIVPNPFMPAAVRQAHFIETASSNFIFGMLLFWLLHRSHRSLQDLFGGHPKEAGHPAQSARAQN